MTEQEFMKHVWRPYDTVEVIGDITGAIQNVCFQTKSVKVFLPGGAAQWFKCRDIVRHISRTDTPDDMSIIEDLHNKLMAANKRNDDLQDIVTELKMKVNGDAKQEELRKIRKASNKIFDAMNSIDSKLRHIDEYLTNLGVTEEEV